MNVIAFTNFLHAALPFELKVVTSNPEVAAMRVKVVDTECSTATIPPTIRLRVIAPDAVDIQSFTLSVYEGEPIHN
jgi:hypothetical protein